MSTVKLFATVGVFNLAPTVQLIVVEFATVTLQLTPSMLMTAVPASRLVPVSVRLYPP